MGFLAYQFPSKSSETILLRGKWKKCDFKNLPEECFFISSFTKEEAYFFQEEEKIEDFPEGELSFASKDELFFVNDKAYLMGLEHFISGFESLGIEKAIYSRIKLEEGKKESSLALFNKLTEKYKEEAFVYLISDVQFGTWMGATPEILLEGNAEKLHTMALAGTKTEENRNWTSKEIEEHQYVIDYVKEIIEKHTPSELHIFPTETVKNGAVYHLKTPFRFSISPEKWNHLIEELHPTPAICGTPKEKAKQYILTYEPHERMFYTGIIGLKNKNYLSVYVNLRCMQILKEGYALYVGGGITKSSIIQNEWAETEAKSETLLAVVRQ